MMPRGTVYTENLGKGRGRVLGWVGWWVWGDRGAGTAAGEADAVNSEQFLCVRVRVERVS